MKWIDYTALTLAIIGAIVWGLIGVFQFNLVSSLFSEKIAGFPDLFMTSSAYPVYIYLPCFGPNRTRYVSICILFPLFYTLTIFIF